MAKRRKLSDLVKEETQRPEVTDLQSTDLQSTDLQSTDLQTPEVPDSQENEVTNLQTTEVTELQSSELTDLQSREVTNSRTTEPTDLQTAEVPGDRTREDTELQSSELTDLQSRRLTELPSSKVRTPKLTDSQTPEVPKYLTLMRKETRLREDQLDRLTAIARKLNRTKRGGERITENTLIRVAVDLLLDRADALNGATETELRDSLSSEETD